MYFKISVLLCFVCLKTTAQFGPKQIISTEAELPQSVVATDINGDGTLDVLIASRRTNNIAWFSNKDGKGNFGSIQLIDELDECRTAITADLDGDNDLDVVVTAIFLDLIVWYENLDGLGTFGSPQLIDTTADGAFDVVAADLDGDGDLDVASASDFSGVAWHENTDGAGTFGSPQLISTTSSRSIVAKDIDGDSDLDLVAGSSGSVTASWYKNTDGQGTFGPQQIIVGAGSAIADIVAVDIDGDLDLDIVTATNGDEKVAWLENLDGLGTFGPEQIITLAAETVRSVFATDLDNDGDKDVLYPSTTSATEANAEIAWSENLDGLGNFGPKQIIDNTLIFAFDVHAADIDNDGDMDVLSASQNDDTIAWYENFTILGVEENSIEQIQLHPNPTDSSFFIGGSSAVTITQVNIYTMLGEIVLSKENITNSVDISYLSSGVYLVKISTLEGTVIKKIVKK